MVFTSQVKKTVCPLLSIILSLQKWFWPWKKKIEKKSMTVIFFRSSWSRHIYRGQQVFNIFTAPAEVDHWQVYVLDFERQIHHWKPNRDGNERKRKLPTLNIVDGEFVHQYACHFQLLHIDPCSNRIPFLLERGYSISSLHYICQCKFLYPGTITRVPGGS